MFKFGLCSISFRKNTAEQIIKAAADAGLDCIEWGSDVHVLPLDFKTVDSIMALQKEYGISCSSYGTYFRIGTNSVDEIYDYIKTAKALGTDTLRVWCGDKGSADYTKDELYALYSDCARLAKIAEAENVYICLECHIKTLTDDFNATDALMKYVANEHFCMYWQPNQFKTQAENIQYAKFVSDITKRIHVFNWKEREKYPLCRAKAQWREYLENFDGGYLLLEFMPDGNIESLKTEAAALYEIAGERQ